MAVKNPVKAEPTISDLMRFLGSEFDEQKKRITAYERELGELRRTLEDTHATFDRRVDDLTDKYAELAESYKKLDARVGQVIDDQIKVRAEISDLHKPLARIEAALSEVLGVFAEQSGQVQHLLEWKNTIAKRNGGEL